MCDFVRRARRLALLGAVFIASPAYGDWFLTDLGPDFEPAAINDSSTIVGTIPYANLFGYRAVRWSAGVSSPLPLVQANGINELGQVIGSDGLGGVLVWTEANGVAELATPDLPGVDVAYSVADINDHGQVVGWVRIRYSLFSSATFARKWDANNPSFPPATLDAGGGEAGAAGNNSSGTIVGGAEGSACIWTGTGFATLSASAAANDINDAGVVVGELRISGTSSRPAFWVDGVLTSLPLPFEPEGTAYASARGLNERSEIVGYFAENGLAFQRAALWKDENVHDLNSFLQPGSDWILQEAVDINERGSIVGIGTFQGQRHGFLLTPNATPTIGSLDAPTIECVEGDHHIVLQTTVDDADDDPLTVTWSVNGEVVETDDVEPGATIEFAADYEHGEHDVILEVSDGFETTIAETTVTVQDTEAPIVIVTNHVTAGTDQGVDYATILELPEPEASDASGHGIASLEHDGTGTYPLGETLVTWTATDEFGNVGTAVQKVTVVDLEKPSIAGSASARFYCDPGKTFSTQRPPEPAVSDNVDDVSQIQLTDDAPNRFPVGRTKVTFTARDGGGNEATFAMDVIVLNRKPRAKAGKDVIVETTSERGMRVSLDGSASFDPDEQRLKFDWSAEDVTFAGTKSATPSALFPVGGAVVTLKATDPLGKSDVDRVRVVVRLKNGQRRPRGAEANAAFAEATKQAAPSPTFANSTSGSALSGLAYAQVASAYGDAAGEFVRWEEGQSEADALLDYAELRILQQQYGSAAADALRTAYAETGDESLLTAAWYAAYGSLAAQADLTEP